jgi:hypothetical protein
VLNHQGANHKNTNRKERRPVATEPYPEKTTPELQRLAEQLHQVIDANDADALGQAAGKAIAGLSVVLAERDRADLTAITPAEVTR